MTTPTRKIHAAEALARQGWTTDEIASVLDVAQRTIQKWLKRNQEQAARVRHSCRAFSDQARILGE